MIIIMLLGWQNGTVIGITSGSIMWNDCYNKLAI
jgi:hypothetical protein